MLSEIKLFIEKLEEDEDAVSISPEQLQLFSYITATSRLKST